MTDVIGMMFMSWDQYGASQEQIAAKTMRYLGAVQDLPVWAVQAAVDRWRDGKFTLPFGESFNKIPSSAVLKQIADDEMKGAGTRLDCLERMDAAIAELPPPVISDEERARVGEKMRQFSIEMGERLAAREREEREAYAPMRARFDAIATASRARRSPRPETPAGESNDGE